MKRALLAIVVCAVFAAFRTPVARDARADLERSIQHVMKTVHLAESGLHLGMRVDDLHKLAEGAAFDGVDYYLRLADTQYDPPGDMDGIVRVSTVGIVDGEIVDSILVVLLGEYELDEIGSALAGAGKKLGLEVELDDLGLSSTEGLEEYGFEVESDPADSRRWWVSDPETPSYMWTIAAGELGHRVRRRARRRAGLVEGD